MMIKNGLDLQHKTIFVLDHGPYMKESSNQMVDYDISTKSRPPGVVPLAPVSKSIWSCCVEALCEYCRIVWDIFPNDKLIRFIVSDCTTAILNSWLQDEQTMAHLMKSLANVGPPIKKTDSSVMLGLVTAIEAMCDITESQKKAISAGKSINNCGRIICITQMKNDIHRKALIDCAADALRRHSELAQKSQGMLPIQCVELVVIHVKPFGSDCCITEMDLTPLKNNPKVLYETHDVKATRHGIAIANRLLNLVQCHYDLSVTSITGIPMKVKAFGSTLVSLHSHIELYTYMYLSHHNSKPTHNEEEQHANSSANYDVLLLHQRLPGTPLVESDKCTWDSELTSTMLLKWCTPKIDVNELFYCTGAARISPVDVNSRPSLCLTNFLLNGRSVSLEHWIKERDGGFGSNANGGNNRVITHMISCKGSDIFLHALGILRCPFEDPPGISDGMGGKVTDYRIKDFSEIIKKSILLPFGDQCKDGVLPIDNALKTLNKFTRCFPLTFSKTVMFNISKSVVPLIELIQQDDLSADDLMSSRHVIFNLIAMERDGNPLDITSSLGMQRNAMKQAKRDEQYKSLWTEMEDFLRAYAETSSNHKNVLECFLECTGRADPKSVKNGDDTNRRIESGEIFESPESPPPAKKQKTNDDLAITLRPQKGAQSLLAMWTQRVENVNSQRHVEFYGRLASDGNKAQLYPNIQEENSNIASNSNQGAGDRQRHGHHRFSLHHRSGSSGNRNENIKSGRSTPQGKEKLMKKLPKNYSTPP